MFEGPRKYDLNFQAANELQLQSVRAKAILERLAAHLAATQPDRDPNIHDLVERDHVLQAAELLFDSASAVRADAVSAHCVFISFSHEDQSFVGELTEKLDQAGITYFKADRDIQLASDWGEAILGSDTPVPRVFVRANSAIYSKPLERPGGRRSIRCRKENSSGAPLC